MSQTSLVFKNEKHAKTQPRSLKFRLQITGAKAVTKVPVGADCLVAFDALSQVAIDEYLGKAAQFAAAAFDATALGANELALLVKMDGQAGKVMGARVELWDAAGAVVVSRSCPAVAALTASTAANECAVSADGELAVKVADLTGLDAATNGQVLVEIDWVAK